MLMAGVAVAALGGCAAEWGTAGYPYDYYDYYGYYGGVGVYPPVYYRPHYYRPGYGVYRYNYSYARPVHRAYPPSYYARPPATHYRHH